MIPLTNNFEKLKKFIFNEKKIVNEIEKNFSILEKTQDSSEKNMINNQINLLKSNLNKLNVEVRKILGEIVLSKPLEEKKEFYETQVKKTLEEEKEKEEKEYGEEENLTNVKTKGGKFFSLKQISPIGLERETVKRLRKKAETIKKKKIKYTSEYSKFASKTFSKVSRNLLGQKSFHKMEHDLTRANLNFTPVGYMSIILMTTFLSCLVAGFLFLFFLFFNFGATLPIITRVAETINVRFFKVFWILFAIPLGTFFMMYVYPGLEKKSAEQKIDTELPFATIHMSAISGSMINPINIFKIISSTKEYPALEKEFTKMINEINIYGYDLVSALKNTANNSPSKMLAELLNGLATTINSGGDLSKFFDKRSETLLFNYRIQQQKSTKAAETSMDMYISLLIAAPMILMLLMMIMKLSGLGIGASVGMISLMIIFGVVILNIIFLTFLQLKRG